MPIIVDPITLKEAANLRAGVDQDGNEVEKRPTPLDYQEAAQMRRCREAYRIVQRLIEAAEKEGTTVEKMLELDEL